MSNDVCVEDGNLLLKAQAVFGADLVEKAFVCIWQSNDWTQEEVDRRLAKEAHRDAELEGGSLIYDTQTIRLQFCTGRVVEFRNSEWASMSQHVQAPNSGIQRRQGRPLE